MRSGNMLSALLHHSFLILYLMNNEDRITIALITRSPNAVNMSNFTLSIGKLYECSVYVYIYFIV